MKYGLTCLLGFFITCLGLAAQSPDCLAFHDGSFVDMEGGMAIGRAVRKGDKQTEYYGDEVIHLSVKWLSDCEYELKFVKGNKAFVQANGHKWDDNVVRAKITATDENGYYMTAFLVGVSDTGTEHHFIIDKK